jgi:hypothetical protein
VELESITLRLRHRRPWEAIDLGHALLRAWAGPIYRGWFATYWLIGLPLLLLLWSWPTVGMMLLWWLKPLLDRILLLVMSRRAFGGEITVREVWRALPGLLKGPGVFSGLTWRRLSMARSFLLPVWQLEQQQGKEARQRFKLLGRRWRIYAVWLTFFCANMSTILMIAGLVLLHALAPGGFIEFDSFWEWISSERLPAEAFVGNLMFMVAETLVEPLYVASGFALYLNRRAELEGWDIELAFRRLAQRKAAEKSGIAMATMLMLAVAALLTLVQAPPAVAAEPASAPPAQTAPANTDADESDEGDEESPAAGSCDADPAPAGRAAATGVDSPIKTAIQEVLAEPVFGKEVDDMEWRPRSKGDKKEGGVPDWLKPYLKAVEFLGESMKALVWILAIVLLAALALLVLRYVEGRSNGKTRPAAPPDFLFGFDVRPASLPADIAAAARAALAGGNPVEALSLLYRGALVSLIHRQQIEFQAGDTEQDCLGRVGGRVESGMGRCFARLVQAWRLSAYGQRDLPADQIAALCDDWARHFGTPVAAP